METSPSGHRLVYVKILVEDALNRGMSVVLATNQEVIRDERFEHHLGHLKSNLIIVEARPVTNVRGLQQLAADCDCDTALVPDALKYGIRILVGATLRAPRVRILVMNDPRWHISGFGLKSGIGLVKLTLLKLSGFRRGVELFWLRPQGTELSSNIVVDPLILDQGLDSTLAHSEVLKKKLGMSTSVFWFGIVGGLSSLKNIPLVVEALTEASKRTKKPVGLALLGPWADEATRDAVTDSIRNAPFPHIGFHEHLTNREMNAMVGALDCAVMAYSTDAPNSTTAKACALGVRVVAAGSATFRNFATMLTGLPGVPLTRDGLTLELLAAIERPRPLPKQLLGPEGLTGSFLADMPSTIGPPV